MYKIHDLLNSCLIKDFLKVFVNLFFVLPWGFFTYAKKKKCMMYQHRICFQLTMIFNSKSHLKHVKVYLMLSLD